MRRLTVLAVLLATALSACGSSASAPKHHPRPVGANPAPEGHKPDFRLVAPKPQHHFNRRAAALAPPIRATPHATPSGVTWAAVPVYADAFAVSLATDTTWLVHNHDNGCCSNGDEIMSERPSKVRVGPLGLELLCSKESTVSGKPFTCGGVSTSAFHWTPGQGQTMAFEVRSQLPPRDFGEDPGWWSTDTKWTDELDFQEDWEWNHEEYYAGLPVWKAQIGGCTVQHEAYKLKSEIPNPETEFHTYTTIVRANGEEEEWIDGVKRWSLGAPCGINKPSMSLILTHALRVASNLAGTNSFNVRSVAVYEDKPGVGVTGTGLAPGTCVEGLSGCTTGEVEEKTTTTPPPPPPPSEKPATPASCTATPHDEGTTAWVSITAPPVSGAAKYVLWRLPGEPTKSPSTPWTNEPTPTFSNHKEVTQGNHYAYWIAAENSAGRSGYVACAVFSA